MKSWPWMPGVPAMGHLTASGFWHPGRIDGCPKCEAATPPKKSPDKPRRDTR